MHTRYRKCQQMLVKFTQNTGSGLNLASPDHLKIQNTHRSQQMASPYKASGAGGLPQRRQTDQMSVWESGSNGKEGQRQTYHLFWSHGKWGISMGWRWAINKVTSVQGGDPWITNCTGLVTAWLMANTSVPSAFGRLALHERANISVFFNMYVHATQKMFSIKWVCEHAVRFGLLDLHCTWLCGLLHIISSKTWGGLITAVKTEKEANFTAALENPSQQCLLAFHNNCKGNTTQITVTNILFFFIKWLVPFLDSDCSAAVFYSRYSTAWSLHPTVLCITEQHP